MAKTGPVTSAELAKATKTTERYVREWLSNQAAGGYVTHDAATERFALPPEQAFALADETSPCFLPGAFQVIEATFMAEPKMEQRFRSEKGLGWGEHDHRLFEGTERFFVRTTRATWSTLGFPRSMASRPSSKPARRSRMSAAGSGPHRS